MFRSATCNINARRLFPTDRVWVKPRHLSRVRAQMRGNDVGQRQGQQQQRDWEREWEREREQTLTACSLAYTSKRVYAFMSNSRFSEYITQNIHIHRNTYMFPKLPLLM